MKATLFMQYGFRILFLVTMTFGFIFGEFSCCTKKLCFGFEELDQVSFHNFEAHDLDSIVVQTFEGTKQLDSTMSYGGGGNINLSSPFKKDRRYNITLLSTGQKYTIGGFQTKRESCNCAVIKPKSDYYDLLETYYINGRQQSASYVYIGQ